MEAAGGGGGADEGWCLWEEADEVEVKAWEWCWCLVVAKAGREMPAGGAEGRVVGVHGYSRTLLCTHE